MLLNHTVLVNTIKPHYTALVNVTEGAHRRVIFKSNALESDAICESEHGSGTERASAE